MSLTFFYFLDDNVPFFLSTIKSFLSHSHVHEHAKKITVYFQYELDDFDAIDLTMMRSTWKLVKTI
jgi:hypothetical protein